MKSNSLSKVRLSVLVCISLSAVAELLNATMLLKHPHMLISGYKKQGCTGDNFMKGLDREYIEPLVIKSGRTSARLTNDHGLEIKTFCNFLVLFLLKPKPVTLNALFIVWKVYMYEKWESECLF